MRLRFLISVFMLLASSVAAEAAVHQRDTVGFAAGLNLRPSYVMPTHGFYNGWNPSGKALRNAVAADVNFSVSDPRRGVFQGAGLAVHTFFSNSLLGTPVSLYLFQGAPLACLSENLSIGYEWNLGVSAGWKDNGIVTVSPVNVYINVAVLLTWRMTPCWDLVFGPEYTHFSNGDTMFPNGGANTVNFRIGTRRHFRPVGKIRPERIFLADMKGIPAADRMTYDLSFAGGVRADRTVSGGELHVFNRAFPFFALNFNPLYHINSYLSAGPSLDVLYDRSANLMASGGNGFSYPGFRNQFSAGISGRVELRMPVFAVNIGIGYATHMGSHTRSDNPDLTGLYGIFSLKAFVCPRLFLGVSYRLSSVLYSHNLMFAVGWRFGKIIPHP